MNKPFTPEILADRWQCSAETVRQMVARGELRGFRVGRMIRIPADAVEDLECGMPESEGSTAVSSSHGAERMARDAGIVLMHSRPRKQKQRP